MGYKCIVGLALVGIGAALDLLGYTDIAGELRKIGELLIGNMEGPNE